MIEPKERQLDLPFDEFVRELDSSLPRERIRESAQVCAEAKLTTARGAFTDSILAENKSADERELQVLAAHAGQLHKGEINRREWITNAVMAALAVGGIYAAYDSGDRQREFDQWRLNPNLVIKIAQMHHLREANGLPHLLKQFGTSNPNEAFLVEAILAHGISFDMVKQNLRRLRMLLQYNSTDPDTKAFLARKYASDHRYLGLSKQARDICLPVPLEQAFDINLRFMMVEMRYGALLPLHFGEPSRLTGLGTELGESLRADALRILNFDLASSTSEQHEHLIRTVSSEAVEPVGLYYRWLFFRSPTEKDAEAFFEKMLSLAVTLVKCGNANRALGEYARREAWWHVARLLPIAYWRGFRRIADRIVAVCEGSDPRSGIFAPAALTKFHRDERRKFRSPVFIDYLLVRALQEFEQRKSVKYFETAFIQNKKYRHINHAVIQRSIASIGSLVGAADKDASCYASLCSVDEGDIMMKCIRKAHGVN